MGRETDRWPFIKARWYGDLALSAPRIVKWIVWHDMEYAETLVAAEQVARYFSTMSDGRVASAHVCIDADSVVQCVRDRNIAYGAPGANSHGIHLELAGVQRQTREQWLDAYGLKLLDRACNVAAQYCVKYDLPPIHLTDDQLADGQRGMVGHDQVSRVFQKSDHTDPGPNFPWDYVVATIEPLYRARLAL